MSTGKLIPHYFQVVCLHKHGCRSARVKALQPPSVHRVVFQTPVTLPYWPQGGLGTAGSYLTVDSGVSFPRASLPVNHDMRIGSPSLGRLRGCARQLKSGTVTPRLEPVGLPGFFITM